MATTNEKVLSHIHDDVALSILSKLPLKSLRRFASICKSWNLLFENPHFMDMLRIQKLSTNSMYDGTSVVLKHLSTESIFDNLWYLCCGEGFETKVQLDLSPPCKDNKRDFQILGSAINGLLCLYDFLGKVVLWNLETDESMIIPLSHIESSLPFEVITDCIHFTLYGFGYDHVGDNYKVIRHLTFLSKYPTYFKGDISSNNNAWQIYNLRSNSWRNLKMNNMPIRDPKIGIENFEVYLNGMCHWMGETYDNCLV